MMHDESDDQLAMRLRALAHPARLALLRELSQGNACTCGALVSALPLAQSTVSEHLRVLKEAGLIAGRADGPRSCYELDRAAATQLAQAFSRFASALDGPAIKKVKKTA
ncbi:MAG: ArsR/SmtB family transcription factor [Beijerinckiaceae bacterium]